MKIGLLFCVLVISAACTQDLNMQNNPKNMPSTFNIEWTDEQKKAIVIADEELFKHFKDKKSFGIEFKPVNVIAQESPSSNLNKIYKVWYSLPNGPTDQDVTVLVDITTGKVISNSKNKY